MKPLKLYARYQSVALLGCLIVGSGWLQPSFAQVPNNVPDLPSVEHEKRSGFEHRLQVFGTDLLGDSIDPNTGSVQFTTTDVSLPGNFGLPVAVTRKISTGQHYDRQVSVEFGDWQIEVPRLHVLTRTGFEWTGNRCTNTFDQSFPPHVIGVQGATTWYHADYTNGLKMDIPGQGSKDVLEATGNHPGFPSNTEMTTVDGWRLICGSANQGQGLIAYSPDGTQYRFDRFMTVDGPLMGSRFRTTINMGRTRNILAATRVTDVNGNTVSYNYDGSGRLTSIVASDGRKIDLSYSGASKLIQSVTANPGTAAARTWTYGYQSKTVTEYPINLGNLPNSLVSVTQPDSQSWSYDMVGMAVSAGPNNQCRQTSQTLAVTHPYGTTGVFHLYDHRSRTSLSLQEFQPLGCPGFDGDVQGGGGGGMPPLVMELAGTMAVGSKTLTGPGLNPHVWSFSYENDFGPAGTSAGDPTNTTIVTEPSGRTVEHKHFWIAEPLGGKLASKTIKDGSTILRDETYTYVQEPQGYGGSLSASGTHPKSSSFPTHMGSTVVTQDGDSYTTSQQYDVTKTSPNYSWGRPITSTSTSSLGGTRTINRSYEHNTNKWILGLLKTTTFQAHPWESLTYDANGRVATYSKFGVQQGAYTYHTNALYLGALNTITNVHGDTATFTDWHRGKPRTVIRYDGKSIYRTLDDNGWELTTTDAKNNQTAYSYNIMGWLASVNPPGSYFNSASLSYVVNPSSSVAMRQTVTRGAATTTVDYDALFRPKTTHQNATDAIGAGSNTWDTFTEIRYDLAGNVVFQSRPSLDTVAAQTNGVLSEYDLLQRLTRTEDGMDSAVVTTMAYASPNKTIATDPSGNITTTFRAGYAGPGGGDVLRIDQLGRETLMNYDLFGNVTDLTQTDLITGLMRTVTQEFRYDANNRLCAHYVPEHGQSNYRYDAAGQLIKSSRGDAQDLIGCPAPSDPNSTEYSYDALGRVLFKNYTNSAALQYDFAYLYDDNGNMIEGRRGNMSYHPQTNQQQITIANTNNVIERDYDVLGNVERERQISNNALFTYESVYTYDANGFRNSHKYPMGNTYVWANDGFGQQQNLSQGTYNYASNITYHPDGSLAGYTLGDGSVFTRSLDSLQRTDRLYTANFSSGYEALDLSYTYDANSRIASILDTASPGQGALGKTHSVANLAYDGLGQLTSADGWWGTGSFTYDGLGNSVSRTLGAGTATARGFTNAYDPATNRMTRSIDTLIPSLGGRGDRWITHDGRGNMTQIGAQWLAYDLDGQLTNVAGSAAGIGSANGFYVYNAENKRTYSHVNGRDMLYMYDARGRLILTYKSQDGEAVERLYLESGQALAKWTGSTLTYLHTDHLGTPIRGTHGLGGLNGEVVGDEVFQDFTSPYGLNPTANWHGTGTSGFDPATGQGSNCGVTGFTTHAKDCDTGLTHMQARYYDPGLARFTSVDPVEFLTDGRTGMVNRFSYTLNDPMNMWDPDGRHPDNPFDEAMNPRPKSLGESISDAASDISDFIGGVFTSDDIKEGDDVGGVTATEEDEINEVFDPDAGPNEQPNNEVEADLIRDTVGNDWGDVEMEEGDLNDPKHEGEEKMRYESPYDGTTVHYYRDVKSGSTFHGKIKKRPLKAP